jgi:uncharacterized membrane protein
MTTITAVTSYEFSLFLHITAVMVGLGSTFALAVTFPVAMALDARHLPYVHRLSLVLSKYFATPALVIVLATGFYQVSKGDWQLGKFWLSATLTIVVVLGGIIGAYFIPTDKRLGEMVQREIDAAGEGEVVLSEEYQRASRTEGIVGAITGLLLVIAVYLMVTKPGL